MCVVEGWTSTWRESKPAATSKGDDDIETTTNADTTTIEASNNVEERSEVREHDDVQPESREILVALMEEIEIDTTPSKSMVAKTLGGPFTFLGQYEDEGIVLMIRKQEEENDEDLLTDELETNISPSKNLKMKISILRK